MDVKGVASLIYNQSNELLLMYRNEEDSKFKGWFIPMGTVNPGDPSPESAMERELKEELDVEALRLEQIIRRKSKFQEWDEVLYLATLKPGSIPRNVETDICSKIGYFSHEQIRKFTINPEEKIAYDILIEIIDYVDANNLLKSS